jgi:hypothetical protein
MSNVFTVFIAVLFFTGCAMQSGYELSAREMLSTEYLKPNLGFLKSWKPLGKNYEYNLSEHEIAQSALNMEACVSQLSSKYPNPPKETLRSLQIIECMKSKGWSFEIEEILIMR